MKKGWTNKMPAAADSKFGSMTQQIKDEYVKKGYDPKTAAKIGAATSAKIGKKKK